MIDPNTLSLPDLFTELTRDGSLDRLLAACVAEDLGGVGDITTASCSHGLHRARAVMVAKEDGVVAGLATVPAVVRAFQASITWTPATYDGERCQQGQALGALAGSLSELLAVERTLLNLVARLCGVATLTRAFVDRVDGTHAAICDTRKTSPGMRCVQKYAVRCGGGLLHRIGLFDAALYKDNHLAGVPLDQLASYLVRAIGSMRAVCTPKFVEVEVDSLEQLRMLLTLPDGLVDMVLLDNMPANLLCEAVRLRDAARSGVLLEASGGVTLDSVSSIAASGVDRISVGALTHASPALDLSLEVVP